MERFARFIVRRRKLVLVIAVLLLIPAIMGAVGTYINYDILTYLPPELESMVGEQYLENDFKIASTAMITTEHMTQADREKLRTEIAAVSGVRKVTDVSELAGVATPQQLLPGDLQKFFYGQNDAQMMIVTFDEPGASAGTMDAISQIKGLLAKDCFIGGASAILQDTKALVDKEMPMYVLVAGGCSMLVLFLSLSETLGPVIFMLGIAFPILYNFGTNIFLGQISYVTEALATVLQLGVTMDYSIFLLHRFEEERTHMSDEDAMVHAIRNTFSSITGSSLTTVAGFLALCFMRLSIGRDIGVVMAKGVFLGVLSTVTILPALILVFRRNMEKHTHRVLIPKLTRTAGFVTRHYGVLLAVFAVLVIPFAVAQSKTSVYYTLSDSMPQDMVSMVGTNRLKKDFNMTTTHFIMVDDSLTSDQIRQLGDELGQVDGITQVLSYEKFVGAGIPEQLVPADLEETFHSGGHRLLLANSTYASGTDKMSTQLKEMQQIVKQFDAGGVISGEGAMTKDLIEVADVDFRNVNIASVFLVFAIIAVVFRSASIPVLLVTVIESAIMINLGIPYFTGTSLPFIASIVIGTIQLGATVDYAILTTSRFQEELRRGRGTKEAVRVAVEQCSQSILTSGLTFFAATASVAMISRMQLLSNICLLISRGALISMAVILLVLPGLLILTAPIIRKTTWHWITPKKESATV